MAYNPSSSGGNKLQLSQAHSDVTAIWNWSEGSKNRKAFNCRLRVKGRRSARKHDIMPTMDKGLLSCLNAASGILYEHREGSEFKQSSFVCHPTSALDYA